MPLKMRARYLIAVLSAVWAWETFAVGREHTYRPSSPIVWTADMAFRVFEEIGRTIAYVSGLLYTWIDVYEIGMAFVALTEPLVRLLVSPSRIICGYVWELAAYHNKWILVIMGTVTLAAGALWLAYAWTCAGWLKPKTSV